MKLHSRSMMRLRIQSQSVLVTAAVVLLGACDSVKEITGQTKQAPDEFAVYSRPPLTLPPDYRLRPPTPGSGPTNVNDPSERAKEAILGATGAGPRQAALGNRRAAVSAVSPGLRVLLRRTGALQTDPNIRETLNRETSILAASDKSFTEKMMFWDKTNDKASVVNPTAEVKRIQANKAFGKPITEGDVPTIKREERGLLEGLF
jgi:hypothetical protein